MSAVDPVTLDAWTRLRDETLRQRVLRHELLVTPVGDVANHEVSLSCTCGEALSRRESADYPDVGAYLFASHMNLLLERVLKAQSGFMTTLVEWGRDGYPDQARHYIGLALLELREGVL